LLDTDEVWTYTKTGTAQPGSYSNTGSVTGSYNGTPVNSSDPSSYFGASPSMAIDKVTKSGSVQGDGLLIPQGSPISWIYTVTNTGNVPLSNVQVTDNKVWFLFTKVVTPTKTASSTSQKAGFTALTALPYWAAIKISVRPQVPTPTT
jgi:hypothetical protein